MEEINNYFIELNSIDVSDYVETKGHKRNKKNGRFEKKHGKKHTRIYGIWCAMKGRCANKHHKSFKHYGGRGIKVCDEWQKDFLKFFVWANENGYADGLTIDRIDINGNYEPGNCRWVSYKQQNRNYSRNHLITFNGETLCLSDMAEKYGINKARLHHRLSHGWSIERALLVKCDGRTLRYGK